MRAALVLACALLAVACGSGAGEPRAAAPAAPAAPITTTTPAFPATTTELPATTAGPDAMSAGDVAVAAFAAAAAADYMTLAELSVPSERNRCTADELRRYSALAEVVDVEVSVGSVEESGDAAVVVVRVEERGEPREIPVPLARVDGAWYGEIAVCLIGAAEADRRAMADVRNAILAGKVHWTDFGTYDASPAELKLAIETLDLAGAGAEPGDGQVAYRSDDHRLLIYAHSASGRSFCAALDGVEPVRYGLGAPDAVSGWDGCAAVGATGGWAAG